jgi:uncharacterized protein (TIGR04255 family)
MIFANPPLSEIVAELHWIPWPGAVNPATSPGKVIQFPLPAPELEETYSRFSNNLAKIGFGNSERLSPLGFPTIPFTPLLRFRKPPGSTGGNFLYQIGPGLFSANALPPYSDWNGFKPAVQDGVNAFLDSWGTSRTSEFTKLSLRYINLFSSEFTDDIGSSRFLNEILGIRVEPPAVLTRQMSDPMGLQAGLILNLPLKTGLSMNLTVVDGSVGGKTGIVMTTEAFSVQPTPPYIQQIMERLDSAHSSLHETFLGLTEKLRDKLQPQG